MLYICVLCVCFFTHSCIFLLAQRERKKERMKALLVRNTRSSLSPPCSPFQPPDNLFALWCPSACILDSTVPLHTFGLQSCTLCLSVCLSVHESFFPLLPVLVDPQTLTNGAWPGGRHDNQGALPSKVRGFPFKLIAL